MIQQRAEIFSSILYLNQESNLKNYIECSTRIHKLTFLAQNFLQDLNDKLKYDFIAHDFGPYSVELSSDLAFEERTGIIEINRNNLLDLDKEFEEKPEAISKEKRNDYKLTQEGIDLISSRYNSYTLENKFILYGIRNLGYISLWHLISIVYYLYPDMAKQSKIKPKIEKIPKEEIKTGIKIFFRTLPHKLILKIYNSNQNFISFFPSIETELSFEIGKLDDITERKLIKKIVAENQDLLEILSKY